MSRFDKPYSFAIAGMKLIFIILNKSQKMVQRKIMVTLALGICLLIPAFGQNSSSEIDSLQVLLKSDISDSLRVEVLIQLAYQSAEFDFRGALKYAREGQRIASNTKNEGLEARSIFEMAESYLYNDRYDSALIIFHQLEQHPYVKVSTRFRINVLTEKSFAYLQTGEIDSMLNVTYRALRMLDTTDFTDIKVQLLMDLSEVYRRQKDKDNALKFLGEALVLAEELGNTRALINIESNRANVYGSTDEPEKSYEINLQVLEKYGDAFDRYDSAYHYNKIGNNLMDLTRYEEAENYVLKGLQLLQGLNRTTSEAYAMKSLGFLYNKLGQPEEAKKYLQQAYDIALNADLPYLLGDVTRDLSTAYSLLSDYENAYTFLLENKRYREQLRDQDRIKIVEEMEKKYETEKKEQQIALQNEKLFTQEARLAQAATQRNALIGGAFLLLVIGALVINRQKLNLKNKAREKELAEVKLAKTRDELELREQELLTYVISIAQKNNLLHNVKEEAQKESDLAEANKRLKRIHRDIENGYNLNQQWEEFRQRFEKIHQSFFDKLAKVSPDLTNTDRRICAYLKLGLSSKQIANLQNVGVESVEVRRSQIRKKLGLIKEESLSTYIMNIS